MHIHEIKSSGNVCTCMYIPVIWSWCIQSFTWKYYFWL